MTRSILLLNPPSLPATIANREGSAGMGVLGDTANPFVYPPHLLATAGAALRAAHWRVAALDAVALGLDADTTLARMPASDVVVLPVSYGTQAADRAFLHRLRERKPLAKVLAIGPALTYAQVDHAFSDLVDGLVMGEPELALSAAASQLLAGQLAAGRAVNPYALNTAQYTPDGLLADLDAVPMPAWELFQPRQSYPFLSVLSSRGCPAGCAFCPYVAAQGNVWRAQTPARTAAEMVHAAQQHHAPHIFLRDPVFAHDRNRVLAICNELHRLGSTVTWECESRPEHFDARVLRALHDAGCTVIKLGVESADPDVLQAIGRVRSEQAARAYLDRVAEVVRWCGELGLLCRVFVMVGLPGQTRASVERTATFLRGLHPIRLHVKPLHWYPGIALPPMAENDLSVESALLRAAVQARPSLWRRMARRLAQR